MKSEVAMQAISKYILSLIILFIIWNNSNGQTASLPTVPDEHPRLFVSKSEISLLREKKDYPEFQILWNSISSSNDPLSQALTYLITGNTTKGNSAVNAALSKVKTEDTKRGLKLFNSVAVGAIVYDWCYPLLSSTQKEEFIANFARIHKTHSPYWPVQEGYDAITGHDIEGWFWNQWLAGIAIYDENQTIFNSSSSYLLKFMVEPRNFSNTSHLHHQGSYIGTRLSHILLGSWAYQKLTGKYLFNSQLQYVPYQLIYHMRPDGQQFRFGDVITDNGLWEHKGNIFSLSASYYNDPYQRWIADEKKFPVYSQDLYNLFEFIFRPANAASTPINQLSLSKYFDEPVGSELIARTGWDVSPYSKDAVFQMRIGQYYFGNHQHKDFGTFQIYYKGNLTGDSGMYQGSNSKFNSDHWVHYYRSTIAHNGLLIYDPSETYSGGKWTSTRVDGGARWPFNNDTHPNTHDVLTNPDNGYKYADVIAHEIGPDKTKPEFSYISGDLTPSYTGKQGSGYTTRAKKVTRSMATFNTNNEKYPGIFVVFDRLVSTNPAFKKTFLLHAMKEPVIDGNKTIIKRGDGYEGKLVSYTLLPEKPTLSKINGYSIRGVNYDPGTKGDKNYEDMRWRVEVSPSYSNVEDEFFHVMAVMDESTEAPEVEKFLEGETVGAKVLDRIIMFSRSGNLLSQLNFEIKGKNQHDIYKVLLCDIEPGFYQIIHNGKAVTEISATSEGQTLYFNAKPGIISVTPLDNYLTKDSD